MVEGDLFLRACRSEPVERTPVWIMRQAGRYLPEYRALREKADFLTCCRTPELACEITLQPVRRLGVDAAILFSDILIPLPGMGVEVSFDPAPKLARTTRTRADIEALRVPDARETTPFVLEAVRLVRRELAGRVPLIGFAGAPFTVATYMAEGGGSKSFSAIKRLLFAEPDLAHALLSKCAATIGSYLAAQVRAGAQAAMLFDTWAGILSPADYETFALPYAAKVFEAVSAAAMTAAPGPAAGRAAASLHAAGGPGPNPGAAGSGPPPVPRIYYAGESAGWIEKTAAVGADVIGIDWRSGLDTARTRLGSGRAVQGNLDPAVLLGDRGLIERRTREVLRAARVLDGVRGDAGLEAEAGPGMESPAVGHVFNLGHGILPETPPENAEFLVETVHRLSSRAS